MYTASGPALCPESRSNLKSNKKIVNWAGAQAVAEK